jgi:8-oxo-dGTP pyrophosphatase MutT (NUDIX family)
MARRRSAIIPYRFLDGRLEVLLITKSSGHGWGIPKGKVEDSLKPHISAAKEACEEAGVLGFIHPINVGTYLDNKGIPVPTFLLEVEIELGKKAWPEKKKRERRWVDADGCYEYVTDEDLLAVIKSGAQCVRSDGTYFKHAIKSYCDESPLNLLQVDEDYAELEYRMANGDDRHIHITRCGSIIKLSIYSPIIKSEGSADSFSSLLLRLNSQNEIGFWCIEQVKDKALYSLTNSVQLKLSDSRHFVEIIAGLIGECDAIEGITEIASGK